MFQGLRRDRHHHPMLPPPYVVRIIAGLSVLAACLRPSHAALADGICGPLEPAPEFLSGGRVCGGAAAHTINLSDWGILAVLDEAHECLLRCESEAAPPAHPPPTQLLHPGGGAPSPKIGKKRRPPRRSLEPPEAGTGSYFKWKADEPRPKQRGRPKSPQELYNQMASAGPNTKILVTPNPELLKFGGATGGWRIKPPARKQKSAADGGPGGGNSAVRPDRIAPARPKSREK